MLRRQVAARTFRPDARRVSWEKKEASHQLMDAFCGTCKQQQLIGPINKDLCVKLLEHD